MALLTAYDKDAQNFILRNGKPHTHKKRRIIASIEQSVIDSGVSFERLFPPKSKRLAVLDEIIFYLSGSGICKVGVERLAKKVGCSPRTVKSAVASLKETNQVVVARLAGGNAGKYIFVYKNHPNFNQILKEVFFIDYLPEVDVIAPPVARPVAPLQNVESVEAVSLEGNKTVSNSFISYISKQEKDIIQESIENDVSNSGTKNQNSLTEQRKKIVEYGANKNQLWFFDMVSDINPPEQLKNVVGILALRLGTDAGTKKAHKGFKLAAKIAANIRDREKNGKPLESIPAVFSDGLKHPLNRYPAKEVTPASKSLQRVQKLPRINPLLEFKKFIEYRD